MQNVEWIKFILHPLSFILSLVISRTTGRTYLSPKQACRISGKTPQTCFCVPCGARRSWIQDHRRCRARTEVFAPASARPAAVAFSIRASALTADEATGASSSSLRRMSAPFCRRAARWSGYSPCRNFAEVEIKIQFLQRVDHAVTFRFEGRDFVGFLHAGTARARCERRV